jgi:hypothetical protein
VAGVDCNRVQVERARRLVLSAAFLNTDATRLDSCLGSFGAVVCAYVLINPAPAGGVVSAWRNRGPHRSGIEKHGSPSRT